MYDERRLGHVIPTEESAVLNVIQFTLIHVWITADHVVVRGQGETSDAAGRVTYGCIRLRTYNVHNGLDQRSAWAASNRDFMALFLDDELDLLAGRLRRKGTDAEIGARWRQVEREVVRQQEYVEANLHLGPVAAQAPVRA